MERQKNSSIEKKKLRKEVQQAAQNLTSSYRQAADRKIAERILNLPEYIAAKTIFCFVSMPGEIDTSFIFADAFARGKCVGVPKCISGGVMEVYEITSLSGLEEAGPYRIREPRGTERKMNPEEIEFAIVPCVSCSDDGRRLGHGGGYYDRYLASCPAFRTVVCRRKEMREDIPTGRYDLAMDAVVCEEMCYRINRKIS